jgi:hypothetical protein
MIQDNEMEKEMGGIGLAIICGIMPTYESNPLK